MGSDTEVSWERYGLIAEIAVRFEAARYRLGKTALQKMIFLLQRSFAVDCDYSYTLYTYGPYSADLARDLDIVAGLGGVIIDNDLAFAGYEIRPGLASADLRQRASGFLAGIRSELDRLVADFGDFNSRDLELRSTAVLLSKPRQERTQLANEVHEAKPHFNLEQIEEAIRALEAKGYVLDGRTAAASG